MVKRGTKNQDGTRAGIVAVLKQDDDRRVYRSIRFSESWGAASLTRDS